MSEEPDRRRPRMTHLTTEPGTKANRLTAACRRAYFRLRLHISHRRRHPSGVARWTNQLAVHSLRQRFDPQQTPDIYFEINTDCNYRCPFCPQAQRPRAPRYATPAAFARVISELQPLNFSGTLTLSVNNEPFLHPQLMDFCRQAAQALPHATLALTSNGSLITPEHLESFAAMRRPPVLTVNDYTPDQTVIQRLQKWRLDPRLAQLPITLQSRTRHEILSNRAGNLPHGRQPSNRQRRFVCTWPFVTLWFTPELKAFQCCSDYEQAMVMGDLNQQPLMEIWLSPPLQRIRAALLAPDRSLDPLCHRCDSQWWELPRHCQGTSSLPRRSS